MHVDVNLLDRFVRAEAIAGVWQKLKQLHNESGSCKELVSVDKGNIIFNPNIKYGILNFSFLQIF